MRWLWVGVAVLSVLATTGCPSEFGKDGRIAKAVHKDTQERLLIERCSDQRRRESCSPGKEDSEDCRRCGGP